MDDLNYCKDYGYIGYAQMIVGEAPYEFYSGIEAEIIMCCRFWCYNCDQFVTGTNDPNDAHTRIYTCGCDDPYYKREMGFWDILNAQEDWRDTLPLPSSWSCKGHPIQPIPFTLDGVLIAEDTDFDALVARTLEGWSPELARPHEREAVNGWLYKLYARLTKTGLEPSVSQAVSRCLTHPSPRVRSAAMEFFCRCPTAQGAERIEEIVAGDRSLFVGVTDPLCPDHSLEYGLMLALGARMEAKIPQAIEAVRAYVLKPGHSDRVYYFMGEYDLDWFDEHAHEIVRANPEGIREVFETLEGVETIGTTGARIARLDCVDPDVVRRMANKYTRGADRFFILKALERRAKKKKAPKDKPSKTRTRKRSK